MGQHVEHSVSVALDFIRVDVCSRASSADLSSAPCALPFTFVLQCLRGGHSMTCFGALLFFVLTNA